MSRQTTPKHSFVHTITVSGVVYILRFERLAPQRFAATSLMAELSPFEIPNTEGAWRITGNMRDRDQFEALLKPRLDEEVE